MGPRIREDNGGEEERWVRRDVMAGGTGGSRIAPTRWLSEGMRGWVPASARTRGGGGAMGEARRDGEGNGRFANRPFQMVVRGNEGWVPACARTTEGRGGWARRDGGGTGGSRTNPTRWLSEGGMGPRMREDNGGEGAMGPRIREDKGERRVTVIWMTDIFGVNR